MPPRRIDGDSLLGIMVHIIPQRFFFSANGNLVQLKTITSRYEIGESRFFSGVPDTHFWPSACPIAAAVRPRK
jgi:hypothetical protein